MGKKLKRFFHKFFKIFIVFMLITLVVNGVVLLAVYINHRNKLGNEKTFLEAPGEMIEVNGHDMHVLLSGNEESEYTLVFMHSAQLVDDSIALKPLFKELSDYRLAYVDRSGYGYSEESGAARDIDTILDETRSALSGAGLKAPYILVPCGTAGLEALYWADRYPEEVSGIIGIGMNYPEEFDGMVEEQYCTFFDYLLMKGSYIGVQRLVKSVYPANTWAYYTELEMTKRKALISRGYYTQDMYNEDLETISNAEKVKEAGWPEDIPVCLIYANPLMEPFVSQDSETKEEYEKTIQEYPDFDYVSAYNQEKREHFNEYQNVTIKEMSGPARLYIYDPEGLAESITDFMNNDIIR